MTGIRGPGFLALTLILFVGVTTAAETRQVAITIDDLPRGGDGGPSNLAAIRSMTEKLLQPFRDQSLPVIGFVNEGRHQLGDEGLREILNIWLDAGAELGNHAYSHPDINTVPLNTYTADILKGEPITRAALASRGKKLEYFRHPYLHMGASLETKQGLQAFLDKQGYLVAPVTIDDADYEYAALYTRPEFRDRVRKEYVPYMESVVAFFEQRSVEVVGREIPQVLLIHASQMNADLMPDLLAMFKRRGYSFVTLRQALADPAYSLPESYVGRGGFSWIHRWSQTKGLPNKGEPDPPAWVEKAYSEAR
jgi:peptidoglycan/xylan/chitin deacetylase (PgdA/CDA1 family)